MLPRAINAWRGEHVPKRLEGTTPDNKARSCTVNMRPLPVTPLLAVEEQGFITYIEGSVAIDFENIRCC